MSDYFAPPVPSRDARPAPPTPVWPGQASVTPVPAPAAIPGWPPYTGSSMSGGLKVLIGLGIAVGSFVLVGILAAIAIPVFLNQRAKSVAAATTVSIPTQVVGLTRLSDARSLELEQQLKNQPGQPEAGVYGVQGSVRAAVTVSRHAMSTVDINSFLSGAESNFQNKGLGAVSFADVNAGHLGGVMRCATVTLPHVTVCMFADHGAYGTVILYGPAAGQSGTARSVREAVEHRA